MAGYTLIPDVIDALVDLWTAAAALGAHPDQELRVRVSDGFANTDADPGRTLYVGVDDPELDDAADAGEAETPWGPLGGASRDDFGSIRCVAEAWNGGDDLRTARRAARDILTAAEAALAGAQKNPWLGIPGALFGSITDVSLRQNQQDKGVLAQLVFTVTYRARI